jgi:predicted signal transduction protein with EAL and GGDEF domain
MLRKWGCDIAQGYHIARPMAAELLTQWLVASAGPTAEGAVRIAALATSGTVV